MISPSIHGHPLVGISLSRCLIIITITILTVMAIAQSNPKVTEKLTEPQFSQAVKQSIVENQAQANNLVAQFRASNCAQTKNTPFKTVKAPTQIIILLLPMLLSPG
jgi:hypothetical protein